MYAAGTDRSECRELIVTELDLEFMDKAGMFLKSLLWVGLKGILWWEGAFLNILNL